MNQGSTVRRTEAQLSALLATESTWLWEGSCNRKGNAGAHSAHTVPGNIKLFISNFFKMAEQERCGPGAAALPNA